MVVSLALGVSAVPLWLRLMYPKLHPWVSLVGATTNQDAMEAAQPCKYLMLRLEIAKRRA